MTVGIRASAATCGKNLEDTMAGSHVEEVTDQVRGRDADPVAPKGRGKKDKSRYCKLGRSSDPLRGHYGGHQGRSGPYKSKHGEGRGGSQGAYPSPSRGHARLVGPGGVT